MTRTEPTVSERRRVPRITHVEGGEDDLSKPYDYFDAGVHQEACKQAADRVVRAWRAKLAEG